MMASSRQSLNLACNINADFPDTIWQPDNPPLIPPVRPDDNPKSSHAMHISASFPGIRPGIRHLLGRF
jgi:hypothetical protein